MHINVREFLAEDVGYRRSFEIQNERPNLIDVKLAATISGKVTVSRLEDGLLVQGSAETELELMCDRCLRSFTRPTRISFDRIYRDQPTGDEMPITDDQIDLAPLIEQELVLATPIKLLDREDCSGLDAGGYTDPAPAPSLRLGDRARLKKG